MTIQDSYQRCITALKVTLIIVAHMLVQLSAAVAQTPAIQFSVDVPRPPKRCKSSSLHGVGHRLYLLTKNLSSETASLKA